VHLAGRTLCALEPQSFEWTGGFPSSQTFDLMLPGTRVESIDISKVSSAFAEKLFRYTVGETKCSRNIRVAVGAEVVGK
jgi:hypothetical protein